MIPSAHARGEDGGHGDRRETRAAESESAESEESGHENDPRHGN